MKRRNQRGGQALVLVTLSLFAMCGMMGLAVDLGWSFFVKKQAQTAADSAAIAAVQTAYQQLKSTGGLGGLSSCASPAGLDCNSAFRNCSDVSSAGFLHNGCLYAIQNGFDPANNTSQTVTVAANIGPLGMPKIPNGTSNCTTAGGCDLGILPTNLTYWVTYSVTQTVPQLFSSVLGNTNSTISAISTGGIATVGITGGAYATNQAGDCGEEGCGVDLHFEGGGTQSKLTAPGGLYLGSICDGTLRVGCAAFNNNPTDGTKTGNCVNQTSPCFALDADAQTTGVQINTGSPLQMRGAFQNLNGQMTFTPSNPVIHAPAGPGFADPTEGLPQPPVYASGLGGMQACGITGGTIAGPTTAGSTLVIGPYQYYALGAGGKKGGSGPSGSPITITGNVTFSASGGASAPPA